MVIHNMFSLLIYVTKFMWLNVCIIFFFKKRSIFYKLTRIFVRSSNPELFEFQSLIYQHLGIWRPVVYTTPLIFDSRVNFWFHSPGGIHFLLCFAKIEAFKFVKNLFFPPCLFATLNRSCFLMLLKKWKVSFILEFDLVY